MKQPTDARVLLGSGQHRCVILMAPSASWRDPGENEDVFVHGLFLYAMISGVNLNGGNLVLLVSSQGATCSRAAA